METILEPIRGEARMAVRAVLHPLGVHGLAEELARLDDIELILAADNDEVAAALSDGASILLTYTWRERFFTPSLRWIQGVGAGFEQYPLERFEQEGVTLTTATGVHVVVAEAAFGLLLALTRRIADAVRDAADHRWVERAGVEVAGSTIAIIGLGTIGEEFARRAQGWDVELIGYKRNPDAYDGVVERVYGPDSLLDVCAMADTLVITMPGSDETRHLIGAEELAALGAGRLINVGRGSVVDEQALIAALTDGELLGAGLDVFEVEPLPEDSPLWDMPHVVHIPHTAGETPRYGERLVKIFRQNLRAFRGEGTPWVNRVVDGVRQDES
jgi:phosphoglycerate dehydrogenase-like enzyme